MKRHPGSGCLSRGIILFVPCGVALQAGPSYEGSQSDCPESNRGRGALRCFTVKLHSEIRPPTLQSRRPIHFWRIVDGFFHRIPCYHNITKAGRFCPHFLKDPENDKKGAGIHKILSSRLVSFQAVHHIRQNHKTAHLSRF